MIMTLCASPPIQTVNWQPGSSNFPNGRSHRFSDHDLLSPSDRVKRLTGQDKAPHPNASENSQAGSGLQHGAGLLQAGAATPFVGTTTTSSILGGVVVDNSVGKKKKIADMHLEVYRTVRMPLIYARDKNGELIPLWPPTDGFNDGKGILIPEEPPVVLEGSAGGGDPDNAMGSQRQSIGGGAPSRGSSTRRSSSAGVGMLAPVDLHLPEGVGHAPAFSKQGEKTKSKSTSSDLPDEILTNEWLKKDLSQYGGDKPSEIYDVEGKVAASKQKQEASTSAGAGPQHESSTVDVQEKKVDEPGKASKNASSSEQNETSKDPGGTGTPKKMTGRCCRGGQKRN
ncbi:unnamed protein product [Amoebophrya sp. A25]|nr:unnamed protein product [Amoebophrya sp. A25]|eukprot:GSA25T00011302001.1